MSLLHSKSSYHPLQRSESPRPKFTGHSNEQIGKSQLRYTNRTSIFLIVAWTGSVVASLLFGAVLANTRYPRYHCVDSDNAWRHSQGLTARHWKRFDGSFNSTNMYKGPPSDDLDRAWDRFTQGRWIDGTSVVLAASDQEMSDSGNAISPETVTQLGDHNGGGSMATIEMLHQLHCLNLLRKWTHTDYYMVRDSAWKNTVGRENVLRDHTDHCIDILRQVIMCNGDMGLVMFHWVLNHGPSPYPDFSTMHQCRDPMAILQRAERYAAPIVQPITKTSVAHELPTFP